MLVELYNDLHDTQASLYVSGDIITPPQAYVTWRALCGVENCRCGNHLGMRGPNPIVVEPVFDSNGLAGYCYAAVEQPEESDEDLPLAA